MFRIAFFVEDKNLPKVLHAVAGLAVNMETPQPVINAVVKDGKMLAQTDGSVSSVLISKIQECPAGYVLGIAEFRKLLRDAGGSEGSAQTYLQRLKAAKILKGGKTKGLYIVQKGKEK